MPEGSSKKEKKNPKPVLELFMYLRNHISYQEGFLSRGPWHVYPIAFGMCAEALAISTHHCPLHPPVLDTWHWAVSPSLTFCKDLQHILEKIPASDGFRFRLTIALHTKHPISVCSFWWHTDKQKHLILKTKLRHA